MLLENQIISVKWASKTKNYYIARGYVFTKYGDSFDVHIKDLPCGSDYVIAYKCDYCNKIKYKKYQAYNTQLKKSICKKDCCPNKDCMHQKTIEQNLIKYGVESTTYLQSVKDKIKATNLQRYGVENVFESQEFQQKAINTVLEKYGENNIFKTQYFKDKVKETNLQKYGVEHHMSLDCMKEKARTTRIKKYGDYHTIASHTFVNGVACSKRQLSLGKYLCGLVNFKIDNMFVDIYMEQENLIIEYDGKGHNLSVLFGQTSQDEFDQKERKRELFFIENGYTLLRVVNTKDQDFANELVLDYIKNKLIHNEVNVLEIS